MNQNTIRAWFGFYYNNLPKCVTPDRAKLFEQTSLSLTLKLSQKLFHCCYGAVLAIQTGYSRAFHTALLFASLFVARNFSRVRFKIYSLYPNDASTILKLISFMFLLKWFVAGLLMGTPSMVEWRSTVCISSEISFLLIVFNGKVSILYSVMVNFPCQSIDKLL